MIAVAVTRDELHRLVDALPEGREEAASLYLRFLLTEAGEDPLLRVLATAPEDDEPETPEEAEAVRVARRELDRGEGIPWAEARRQLLGR